MICQNWFLKWRMYKWLLFDSAFSSKLRIHCFFQRPFEKMKIKVVWMSSNFERFQEVWNHKLAKNFSCLSHEKHNKLPGSPKPAASWSGPFKVFSIVFLVNCLQNNVNNYDLFYCWEGTYKFLWRRKIKTNVTHSIFQLLYRPQFVKDD